LSTLLERVVWRSVGGTVVALLVVGLATSLVLDVRARRSRDDELLAAASAFAHAPDGGAERWGSTLPGRVVVAHWDERRSAIARSVAMDLLSREGSAWFDVSDQRVLLHVTEPVDAHRRPGHPHDLIEARAPRVTFADAAGPFLLAYTVVAATLATVVAAFMVRSIEEEIRPISDAVSRLSRVGTLGTGARMPEDGPGEVRALLGAVNGLLDRLDVAFATQSTFTADAAHELRTPLAVLRGEIELALRRPRTVEEHVRVLDRLAGAVHQLTELVEGLMALARVDAGQVEQGKAPERLSAVVQRAIQRECPSARLEIAADPEVVIHTALCEVAVGNLIRNAVRHAAPGPDLVRVDADPTRVRVEVFDRGAGVPPAATEHLFGRFARQDRRDIHGLGLGLPLAREVARRHGGDCGLTSREGGGTVAWWTVSR
jgi:signal transduction histidine kinase